MSLARYAVLVLVLVVLGLITVWGHLRLLSVGYEVNDLRARRVRLEEEVRVQERRIDAIAAPAETAARVKMLGLDLVPPSSAKATVGKALRSFSEGGPPERPGARGAEPTRASQSGTGGRR